jgi:hypothetical protein
MIRNLKILIAAAMALAAIGAISASGAQAAEGHCSVEPCKVTIKPDGTPGPTGKTAHHVFVVKSGGEVSVTCQQLSGEGTSPTGKTFKTIQFGNLKYQVCNCAGGECDIEMNGCEYHFETPGVAPHDAKVKLVCPAGKSIVIKTTPTECLITVGSQGPLTGGIKFHDAETGGVKKDLITAESTVSEINTTIHNSAACIALGLTPGTGKFGTYTTGNVELTGETNAGVHANLWWE